MTREETLQLWRNHFGDSLTITEKPDGQTIFKVSHTISCSAECSPEALEFTTPEIINYNIEQVQSAMERAHLTYSGLKEQAWKEAYKTLKEHNESRRTIN